MRFIVALLIAAACFGQARQNVVQTGTVDARGTNWLPPSSTFASPPATPATGSVYIFTDAAAAGTCSGGGSSLATCRWSGSAWAAVGGSGSASMGLAGAMQTSNGAGSLADGGCTMLLGVLTCGPGSPGLMQFVEGTAPASPSAPYTGALYQDSADHHFKVKLAGGTVIDLSAAGISAAPYVSGTFTSQTHVTIPAATHGFSTKGLAVMTYDTSGNLLAPDGNSPNSPIVVDPSTHQVDVYFALPTTFFVAINGGVGPAGANGTNGTNGSNGSAATIAVGTVTTGAAGSGVIITNSGTSSAATLNFTIPRGDTGVSGSGTGTINSGTAGQVAVYTGTGTTVGGNTLTANGVVLGGGASAPTVTSADTTTTHALFATAGAPAFRALAIGDVPAPLQTESKCVNFGSNEAAAPDLTDAQIGPQGNIFKVPSAVTVIEIAVSANAGTPKVPIIQKNHFATGAWTATDITSAALATGTAGIETCAATGAACLSTVAKDGTVTIVTAGNANVLAAGDWIQTKTGSGFASAGAKRLSVCVTYSR